jgi:hypothetical protein
LVEKFDLKKTEKQFFSVFNKIVVAPRPPPDEWELLRGGWRVKISK